MSEPIASVAIPAANAAAEPPDDPPGVHSRFHGLRVTPQRLLQVTPSKNNSGRGGLCVQDSAGRKQLVDHRMIFATYFFLEQHASRGHFPASPAILFFHRDRNSFEGTGVAPFDIELRIPLPLPVPPRNGRR